MGEGKSLEDMLVELCGRWGVDGGVRVELCGRWGMGRGWAGLELCGWWDGWGRDASLV